MAHTFEYHAPETLEEAFALLAQYGAEAQLLAGGTDLLVAIREGHRTPGHLINIKRISELYGMEMSAEGLRIGALTTANEIATSPDVIANYPALAEGAASMAAIQIRNLATVGGNLCNASPAADLAPPLLIFGAEVEIAGSGGVRKMPLSDFFTGPGQNALEAGEVLLAVHVPPPTPGQRSTYIKLSPRKAMDIAVASVAVMLRGNNGHCEDVHIVMGAVGPTPLRATQTEAILRGQPLDEATLQQAAQSAAEEARPIDDVRASAWYRKSVMGTLTRRALNQLIS